VHWDGTAFLLLEYFTGLYRGYSRQNLYSKKLANFHFWIGTLGIIFYAVSMYWSAVTQSLMWKEFNPLGMLQYPNFLETVLQIVPMYIIRAIGGTLYLPVLVMAYNLYKTAKSGSFFLMKLLKHLHFISLGSI
jgi:cytochrome c oxidase cbb3-type subunit I/II